MSSKEKSDLDSVGPTSKPVTGLSSENTVTKIEYPTDAFHMVTQVSLAID